MSPDRLRISRWETRYRLPDPAGGARERLDRLLGGDVLAMLDTGLARTGMSPYEEICIQRVATQSRLPLDLPDSRLGAEWTGDLVAAIQAAVDRGGPGVVRYRSRHAAVVEVVSNAAGGDFSRAWAWTELGLWPDAPVAPGRAAIARAFAVLVFEARIAPSVLSAIAIAAPARFRRLLELAGPEAWEGVAEAAAEALARAPVQRGETSPAPLTASPRRVDRSPMARCVAEAARSVALPLRTLRAAARLVALEAEPAAAGQTTEGLIDAIVAELYGERQRPPLTSDAAVPARAGEPADAPRARKRPAACEELPLPEAEAIVSSLERPRVWTRFGGLLFLWHLVRELGIAAEALEEGIVRGHTTRWYLHGLAMVLDELAHDDPAALAFAGLAPDRRPPSEEEAPPVPSDQALLRQWRARIVAALRHRLSDPPSSDEVLLGFVGRRRGEIVVDPAWIEVRLSLDELSTEVRRAGLDLDPGWLPWIGAVVRFVYG